MTVVRVAFPVLRGTRRFMIERGRRWSVVEHLLLEAASKADVTAASISDRSSLPRRVVIEAFIRLMRAGWIEVVVQKSGARFRITPAGRSRVQLEDLPAVTVTEAKWRSFAVDQITGTIFRARELEIFTQNSLPESTEDRPVRVIPSPERPLEQSQLSEVFAAIEGEDELIVGIDRATERMARRYALVTVRGDEIAGLPVRADARLRKAILMEARTVQDGIDRTTQRSGMVTEPKPPSAVGILDVLTDAAFDQSDLVFGGDEHAKLFDRMLASARDRLIIHSTFINASKVGDIASRLVKVAQRGVRVEVLWGQDDSGPNVASSREAAQRLRSDIEAAGWSDTVHIHPFSTMSHAKVIIANQSDNSWHAVVGSCNWLASDFTSFEASVRLREPAIVSELAGKVASLSRGRQGVWSQFAQEMSVLSRRIAALPASRGRRVPMRLVYGGQHADLCLAARDNSQDRMFAVSHRIGVMGEPFVLLPALSAVEERGVTAKFYFGRTTGPLVGSSADLVRTYAGGGVRIQAVHDPRIHAKVLGWDDDYLAISSLNWLSADPSDQYPASEIGILLKSAKLSRYFMERFELLVS